MSRSKHSYDGKIRSTFKNDHKKSTQQAFRCVFCRRMISVLALGTQHRNHCPNCLWSKHVDNSSGDRLADCQGKMEPISVWVKGNAEWALVHRCTSCSVVKTNRIAGDDNEFVLMSLASKPIAQPPFPLEQL